MACPVDSGMKIETFNFEPIFQFPFLNAGRRPNDFYEDRLPVFTAKVDQLPDGVDAFVVTADLQGRAMPGAGQTIGLPLLGEVLPGLLSDFFYKKRINPKRIMSLLAGDFYTYPDLHGRGGTGDVLPVWQTISDAYGMTIGVPGNHDTFGETKSYVPRSIAQNAVVLDGERIESNGLSFAGLGGLIGNPIKNFRRDHEDFFETLELILLERTDVLLMHTGPSIKEISGCKGEFGVRELIEKSDVDLLIRGHAHWPRPFVEMDSGTQILNVDCRVVILM